LSVLPWSWGAKRYNTENCDDTDEQYVNRIFLHYLSLPCE
jgi:hypothetical protein